MSYKPGDAITFFPTKHPRKPRAATFIAVVGTKVKILVKQEDGSTKEVQCSTESIERTKPNPFTSTLFIDSSCFRN